ncbi:cytochrome P450 [Colletotrichum lupini]|uniref:Cytochrome P450 n=1 Tax=Colletotrichum lupini TaxID=145971 RepID=A0A9Q8STJ0_9PEZI|nr:cytochrome P450 [Colletotrichum lupini]UQC82541.1 cytochrome P450 [Colletotrichum lupini]
MFVKTQYVLWSADPTETTDIAHWCQADLIMRDYEVYTSAAVSIIVLYSIASIARQYARLKHIRGPSSAVFTKWWLVRALRSGRVHLEFYEAYQKYGKFGTHAASEGQQTSNIAGSLVRVGPRDLITSDPDLMKHMLGVRTKYRRSDWYDAMRLDPGRDNVLSMRDEALHAQLRSRMAAGCSGKEVENLEGKVDENILRLIDLVDRYVSENKAFDFGLKAQYFTLDVISDLTFGEPFGDVASDSDVHEYIRTSEQNMPNVVLAAVLPWLLALLSSPLLRCLLPSDKDAIGFGKTIGLAGSDTTATAIRAMLLHIITSPRVSTALREEIELAKPSWPVITEAEARSMPYLQAVIKEGLRIFPPLVGQMSKEVPKGGDTFKGSHLPEGTRIGYGAWAIFHRTDLWGPDTHEFRPER